MTTSQEIYQQTHRRQYSTSENAVFDEAEKALSEAGFDFTTDAGKMKNSDLIFKFYESNRGMPVTLESLYGFIQEHKSEFATISAAQRDYLTIASENLPAAIELERWYQTQNILVSSPDDQLFSNLKELLIELRGRAVNVETIHQAIQRNQAPPSTRFNTNPHRKPLFFIPTPHRVDPRSHTHPDRQVTNQTPAPPQNEPLWRKLKREREERDARNNPQPVKPAKEIGAWKTFCQGLLKNGHTHGENQKLQDVYDRGTAGTLEWTECYKQMKEVLKVTANRVVPTAAF